MRREMGDIESRERLVRLETNQLTFMSSQARLDANLQNLVDMLERFMGERVEKDKVCDSTREDVIKMKASHAATWKTLITVSGASSTVGAVFAWVASQWHLFDSVKKF